ncbi:MULTISPECIES: tape measure protein [unclassified Pseudonocardia]|uniref:tape measure protein n=1 Tax=unclassified Pseudonocardia TaxID=2619320 RepID=UPI001CF63E1E|nr:MULTISPECIES: tape measure protein [unclassified Pseudonocardia]
MTGLYGSAQDAGDMMERLKRLSSNSPIEYQAYAKASQQLAYMGVKGQQAEDVLRNVGASITNAGGDSSAMERANDALLRMVNSGRVYASDLQQLS